MVAVLKEIILDFQRDNLFTGITRHIDYEIIKDKVFICIGVRRSGKTTLLHQIIRKLKNEYKEFLDCKKCDYSVIDSEKRVVK